MGQIYFTLNALYLVEVVKVKVVDAHLAELDVGFLVSLGHRRLVGRVLLGVLVLAPALRLLSAKQPELKGLLIKICI